MEDHIEVESGVLSVLAGTMFRVELDNKHHILAHISGKMRKRFIRLTVGDRVKMEMSPTTSTKPASSIACHDQAMPSALLVTSLAKHAATPF